MKVSQDYNNLEKSSLIRDIKRLDKYISQAENRTGFFLSQTEDIRLGMLKVFKETKNQYKIKLSDLKED